MDKKIKEIILISIIILSLVGIYVLSFNLINQKTSEKNEEFKKNKNVSFSDIEPKLENMSLNKLNEMINSANNDGKYLKCLFSVGKIPIKEPRTDLLTAEGEMIIFDNNNLLIKLKRSLSQGLLNSVLDKNLSKIYININKGMLNSFFVYNENETYYFGEEIDKLINEDQIVISAYCNLADKENYSNEKKELETLIEKKNNGEIPFILKKILS